MQFVYLFTALSLLSGVFSAPSARQTRNNGIHLAVSPNCGSLTSRFASINAGVGSLSQYKKIITFGDSYTDNGNHAGGTPAPAVVVPPNPSAGGRIANGPVWIEDLASDIGAPLMDYAVSGAVTNKTLWPSRSGSSELVAQVPLFLSQKNTIDPATTVFTLFFGINDFTASLVDGSANLPLAAQTIIDQIKVLAGPPTNGRSFIVLDDYSAVSAPGRTAQTGDAFKQKVFSGLVGLRSSMGLNIAYVDFLPIWAGVFSNNPGFAAFGYTSSGNCITGSTTNGACSDPDHTFSWIVVHPSKQTHRIMADYVEQVLANCRV